MIHWGWCAADTGPLEEDPGRHLVVALRCALTMRTPWWEAEIVAHCSDVHNERRSVVKGK